MSKVRSFRIKKEQKVVSQDRSKEIIFLIRKLIQGGELYTKELNKKYQITSAQLNCLLALYENGPLPPSQIAKHMMVKSSTVTGVIDRLEQKGLVNRARNSPDRRIITIQLTETGRAMAESAPPADPAKGDRWIETAFSSASKSDHRWSLKTHRYA